MADPKTGDKVMVLWRDAEDWRDGTWASTEEAHDFAGRECLIETVGFLVRKTKTHVTVAGDFTPDPDTWGRLIRVPRKMVVKIEALTSSLSEPSPSTTPTTAGRSASAPLGGAEKP